MINIVIAINTCIIVITVVNLNICVVVIECVGNYRSVNPRPRAVAQCRGGELFTVGDSCRCGNCKCRRSCLVDCKCTNFNISSSVIDISLCHINLYGICAGIYRSNLYIILIILDVGDFSHTCYTVFYYNICRFFSSVISKVCGCGVCKHFRCWCCR